VGVNYNSAFGDGFEKIIFRQTSGLGEVKKLECFE